MVKSVENGTSLAPFLVKCYEMVNDESTNDLICWDELNDSFIIWDESKFASQLLPKYFKHSNFSSFVRQLNIYGFKKIDTDRWQFANDSFIKGQKHILKNITRKKQTQNPAQQNSTHQKEVGPTPRPEQDKRLSLYKEVESLKNDRNALTQELKKLTLHQQTSQSKLLLLREQLKGMEKNQQQMLSFIVMAMQRPEFLLQFFQPKENNNNNWIMSENGKSKLSEVTDDFEPGPPSDGAIVRYQPLIDGPPGPQAGLQSGPAATITAANSVDFMEFDFASDDCEPGPPSDGAIVRYQPPIDEQLGPQSGPQSGPAVTIAAANSVDFMEFDFASDEMRELLIDIGFFLEPANNGAQFVLPENDNMMERVLLNGPDQDCEIEGEGNEANKLNCLEDDDDIEFHNEIIEAMESQSPSERDEKVEVLNEQTGSEITRK